MACVSPSLTLSPRLSTPHSNFSFKENKSLVRLRSPLNHYTFPRIVTKREAASDKLPNDVKERAMEAIDECGFRIISVGDVASKAGLKVTEALQALEALVDETDGFLKFSDEGDFYVLPWDYRSKLLNKGIKTKVVVGYLIRFSFFAFIIINIIFYLMWYTFLACLFSSPAFILLVVLWGFYLFFFWVQFHCIFLYANKTT